MTGATGINIGGINYDVSFERGSCIGLFPGCDTGDFVISASTIAASQAALTNQVFIDGPAGLFDSVPSLINGCPAFADFSYCIVSTPYSPNPNQPITILANSLYLDQAQSTGSLGLNTIGKVGDLGPDHVWAVWSVAAPVPEPEAYAMMLAGLAVIGAVARRRARSKP